MGEVKTITKIPVRAVALMGGAIEAILGLIVGIIKAIGIGAGVSTCTSSMAGGAASTLISAMPGGAVGAAVVAVVGGAVGGFIAGYIVTAIVALIYNGLAPRIGGVKLELE
jgi:hypothetical protein